MSTTPRTDSEWRSWVYGCTNITMVQASFARELERELADCVVERDELKAENERLAKELVAMTDNWTVTTGQLLGSREIVDQLKAKLATVRAYLGKHCDCPVVTRWKDSIDIQVKLHKPECESILAAIDGEKEKTNEA